jgi:hypothetical protein
MAKKTRKARSLVAGRKGSRKTVRPAERGSRRRATATAPSLRRELVAAIRLGGKLSRRLRRRFEETADEFLPIDDWNRVMRDLVGFEQQAAKAVAVYDTVMGKVKQSGDVPLQQAAALVDASGYRNLIVGIEASLSEQAIAARGPIPHEDRRDFHRRIKSLLERAQIVSDMARELQRELEREGHDIPPEQFKVILAARRSLGDLVTAGCSLAEDCRLHRSRSFQEQLPATLRAISVYEKAVDAVNSEIGSQAGALQALGRMQRSRRLHEFVRGVRAEIEFDVSIIHNLKEVIGAAIRLPGNAATLAAKLNRITRDVLPRVATSLSRGIGETSGQGDLAANEMIRAYGDLNPKEVVVVDVFRRLVTERGPTATLTVPEVVALAGPELEARGLAAKEGTIRAVLRGLSMTEESILVVATDDRSTTGGHGGTLRYRLTVPAARNYPAWTPVNYDERSSPDRLGPGGSTTSGGIGSLRPGW